MPNCNWKKIKQKSASLAEWKCNTCGEVGYSSHKHGPINCLKNLSESTGKFTTDLSKKSKKLSYENKFDAEFPMGSGTIRHNTMSFIKRGLLFVLEIAFLILSIYSLICFIQLFIYVVNGLELNLFVRHVMVSPLLLFYWLVIVVAPFVYFYLRKIRIDTCPRCEKRGAFVKVDVSDSPLGYTSETYSYDANIFLDQPKDIRYRSELVEFGLRSIFKKCKNCGFSEVLEKKYKKRF